MDDDLLERGGYRVLEARGGEEALERLKANPDVALVVTDVVMPETGGMELGRTVSRKHRLPVLYVSGFADAFDLREGPFLAKPFDAGQLLREVRELLDAPAETLRTAGS